VAEGDVHKRQRKVIQPAFNVSAMRDLTPLFFRHANAFVAKLGEIVDASKGPLDTPFIEGQSVECAKESKEQKPALDISHWYGRITLDIIGDAGFGHPFDAVRLPIDQQTDSIVDSFRSLMRMVVSISIFELIMIGMARIKFFQWTERLPTRRRRVIRQSRMALDRTGLRIIEMKRMQIVKEMQDAGAVNGEKQFFEETKRSKDLLYLMMKANMAPDVRDSERMSDAELLGQITTLLTAGHETTSTLLTWFTYIISQAKHKHILQKLREEIDEHFAGRDQLDYDALMAMPYLDNCTKEILRLLSPVVNTEREASHDDVIPLGKAYKTRDGKGTFNSVAVKKGQMLFIPIQVVNRSKKIWGANADEFDPERWYDVPRMAKETGFPSHILSFLEGPRGCIGNRFAVAEFKAILCTIVRTFDFDQVADWKVERKQGVVVRPRVVGQEEVGTQLPVYLSRV
jgi:cytochrome P450